MAAKSQVIGEKKGHQQREPVIGEMESRQQRKPEGTPLEMLQRILEQREKKPYQCLLKMTRMSEHIYCQSEPELALCLPKSSCSPLLLHLIRISTFTQVTPFAMLRLMRRIV
jgi:hypothetical protein